MVLNSGGAALIMGSIMDEYMTESAIGGRTSLKVAVGLTWKGAFLSSASPFSVSFLATMR